MMLRLILVLLLLQPCTAWAQLYVRRPLHLDNRRPASVEWQDCMQRPDASTCGEVEALLPASSAGTYTATVSASPLISGLHTLRWEARIGCSAQPAWARVSSCRPDMEGRVLWQIAGYVMSGQTAPPGSYQGSAILTMEGQQEVWSARIPVTLEIAERPPVCGIAGGGRLDFGRAEVRRSSAITHGSGAGAKDLFRTQPRAL